jgi:hypothetical protein
MAGNHKRDRVFAHGRNPRPRGARTFDATRDIGVSRRASHPTGTFSNASQTRTSKSELITTTRSGLSASFCLEEYD